MNGILLLRILIMSTRGGKKLLFSFNLRKQEREERQFVGSTLNCQTLIEHLLCARSGAGLLGKKQGRALSVCPTGWSHLVREGRCRLWPKRGTAKNRGTANRSQQAKFNLPPVLVQPTNKWFLHF